MPLEIVKALKENADSLDPIRIEWTRLRSTEIAPKEFYPIVIGPDWVTGDTTFSTSYSVKLLYQKGKIRKTFSFEVPIFKFADDGHNDASSIEEAESRPLKFTGTSKAMVDAAFDGEKYYEGNREDSGPGSLPGLLIETPDNQENSALKGFEDKPRCHLIFMENLGFKLPASLRDYQKPRLRSYLLDLIDNGAHVKQVENLTKNDDNLVRVTIETINEIHIFDLDPSRNFAVKRKEMTTPKGIPLRVITLNNFHRVKDKENIWLPHHCSVKYFQWQGIPKKPSDHVFFTEDYSINKIDNHSSPETEFIVVYDKPGTHIGDGTLPGAENSKHGQINYKVPANLDDLDKVIEHAISGKPFIPTDLRDSKNFLSITLVLSNAVILVVIIIWYVLPKYFLKKKQ